MIRWRLKNWRRQGAKTGSNSRQGGAKERVLLLVMVISWRWTLRRLILHRSHHKLVEKIPVEIVGRRAAAAGSRTWWMVDGTEARADGNGVGHRSISMAQKLLSHVFSARLEPAIKKSGSRRNLVCLVIQEGGPL